MTTIFWPYDVKSSGFCYGWDSPCICVAGVLEQVTDQAAREALQSLHRSVQWRFLATSCGREPKILGKCEFAPEYDASKKSRPILQIQNCENYTLIYYHRHQSNTLRFYTLDIPRYSFTAKEGAESSAYHKSTLHDITAPKFDQCDSSINEEIITQFNSSKSLEQALESGPSLEKEESRLIRTLISVTSLLTHLFASFSVLLSKLCNCPIAPSPTFLLKDVSATFQQFDVRAEQLDFFATETGSLRRRKTTPIGVYTTRYTNFFNAVWLVLNDIIMGIAFGSFIHENHAELSEMLVDSVKRFLILWVQWTLRWLDSWPAGLKLNTELSRFYAHTFISLVSLWGDILSRGVLYLPGTIYVIGTLSGGGITIAISLLLDLLDFLTIHVNICYELSRIVYRRMLITAGSLWNLFRGKRYNVLRNRTDSWEYDIDQLLFGTILFTLLAFLFPTVLVYYSLFALMRLCILLIQASLETLLAFMNHFPLFAVMLRVKDPWRLPGGIYFVLDESAGTPTLVVKNQPVPLSVIFFQYIELLSQLARHYNPLRLLRCLFLGQQLAAIPRYSIRYNKISVNESNRVYPN